MSRCARIVAGVVVEFAQVVEGFDLARCYPPAFLAECSPAPDDVQPGWTAAQDADGGWSYAAPVPPRTPVIVQTVSSLAFLNLFTEQERDAVFTAAPHSPALFGFLFQLACAGSVQLNDPRVIAGVGLLGSGGLVAPSRPSQVLGNILADAVTFDIANAVELGPVLADAVSFDTSRFSET